eukprot:CAMPEP_0117623554 /NCGR_PEP_ID=MMETSP0784-20121206/88706_1 /TAXON_ID=39447 /ORGANISM="" /LENGTH=252 /DNA_ID=CAMNT_0005427507 /DNA_START=116 /DNA_END=870 /DNA_ORIENTATION=+
MYGTTVMTDGQEKEAKGTYVLGGSWNGKGTHMWRLKQEKPELFEQKEKEATPESSAEKLPPGFKPCETKGWLYNADRNIFLEEKTLRLFWFDEAGSTHRPLNEGLTRPAAFLGGATAVPEQGNMGSVRSGMADTPSAKLPIPKHILISDLHSAAKVLKMNFDHFDRPAGLLAIIGAAAGAGGGNAGNLRQVGAALGEGEGGNRASPALLDTIARALPERLLKRLAACRSEWSDEMLAAAIAATVAELGVGGV